MADAKKKRQRSTWEIVKALYPYFRKEGKKFLLTLLLVGFKVGSDIYLLLSCRGILKIVEDYVKGGARGPRSSLQDIIAFTFFRNDIDLTVNDLPTILTMMCLSLTTFFVAGYFRHYVPTIIISNVGFSVRRALYGHLQCMDLYFFDRTRSGEISSRLTNDIMQGVQIFGMTVSVAVFQSILFVATAYFMWKVNPLLTGAALAVGVLFAANMRFFVPKLRERSRTVQRNLGEISGEVNEKFSGIKVTQSFTNEDRDMQLFTERIENHRMSSIKMGKLSAFTGIFGQGIPELGNIVILGLGAYIVLRGDLTMANLTFFWMMRTRLFQPFVIFTHMIEQIARGMGGLDRVFEFFDMDSRVTDAPDAVELKDVRGDVEFKNVTFSYESERNQRVLNNLNFRAEPGMSIALVGASGSGKTTTVDLLSRFYDPTEGSIFVDGRDIREYRVQSLRDNIGVVMQEPILFSGTIGENVRYGKPDASCKEVKEALKMANAWEFVSEMPDKMDSVIGERGVSLSGGQRQRIAIARAFLKNPPILVLDEATSALDSVSELFVQEAIERLMKNRTTLVIAHRLSTIANVDKIVVLDQGKLVEEGSHEELLSHNGYYAGFYNQQFGSFARREAT